ncbi:MAG: hypothetical protein AAF865_07200 [Pseudomonadota bacterium]
MLDLPIVRGVLLGTAVFSVLLYGANSDVYPLWVAVVGGLAAMPLGYAVFRWAEKK